MPGPRPTGDGGTQALARTAGLPRVRVRGSSYERGRQYGAQARSRVHLSVQSYRRVFEHYAGWDWGTVRRAAAGFQPPIAAFRAGYLEEMRGIADGAGLDLADVLAINVRTEVMYAAMARQAPLAGGPRQLPAECSAFAVAPPPGARAPGQAGQPAATLLGQNWDWLLRSAQTLIVLEVIQDGAGPDFVTVVEAGLLAKAGMNAAGLGLVTNALVTDADAGQPGLPYHVLLRAVLDCATVTEALAVLQAGARSSSANFLIAHASGAVLDVEAAPGDLTRLYPLFPDDGVLLHTNHFLAPRIHPVDLSLWAMPSSAIRLQRLRAGTAEAGHGTQGTGLTLDHFRALLADHADYPHGICSHPDPGEHPCEQSATIASLLMDLTAGQLWVAAGNPCQVPYQPQEVSWTPWVPGLPGTAPAAESGPESQPPGPPGPAGPAAPGPLVSAAATAARRR
jgi:isopenicillin-N N-acyltransferase like protein